jgi:hypothetical protein
VRVNRANKPGLSAKLTVFGIARIENRLFPRESIGRFSACGGTICRADFPVVILLLPAVSPSWWHYGQCQQSALLGAIDEHVAIAARASVYAR